MGLLSSATNQLNLELLLLVLTLISCMQTADPQPETLKDTLLYPYPDEQEAVQTGVAASNKPHQMSLIDTLIHHQEIREAEVSDAPLLEEGSGVVTNSCVLLDRRLYCASGLDDQFDSLWPQTPVGEEQQGKCFGNTAAATRTCLSDCLWDRVNCSASDSLLQLIGNLNVQTVDELVQAFLFITETDREPEILSEVYLLNQILLEALANGTSDSLPFQRDFLSVCSNLLDQQYRELSIEFISESSRYQAGTLMLLTLDMFGITDKTAMTENILLEKCNGTASCVQVIVGRDGLLAAVQPQVDVNQAEVLVYTNLTGYLPEERTNSSDIKLATAVVSFNLICDNQKSNSADSRKQLVTITLRHSESVEAELTLNRTLETLCVYWELPERVLQSNSFVTGYWSSEQCQKNSDLSNVTHTVCECTRTGVFAAILTADQGSDQRLSESDLLILTWIYAFGASFSLLALIVTITTFIGFRSLWSMSSGIRANLCVTSSLVILSFAVRGESADNVPLCTVFAVLKQYFLIVTFMWMLEDGIVLLLLRTTDKFKHKIRYYILGFTILAYGAPLLYLGVSLPIGFLVWSRELWGYGETSGCFLRMEPTKFYITYLVPIGVMLAVDMIVFSVVVTLKCNQRSREESQSRKPSFSALSVHSILLIYFGLTWIIVVFTENRPLVYLSTVLISLQGVFLFILYVLCSKKARESIGLCLTQSRVQCKHVFILKRFKHSGQAESSRPSSFVYEATDTFKYDGELHRNPLAFEQEADDELKEITPTRSLTTKSATNPSDVSLWRMAHKASRMSRVTVQPTIEEIEEKVTMVTFL